MKQIWLLEDDSNQAAAISEEIERRGWPIQLNIIRTESDFRTQFQSLSRKLPDLYIIDVMLTWRTLTLQTLNDRSRIGEPMDAGFRCVREIAQDADARGTPIIIYSVLDSADLASKAEALPIPVVLLEKAGDERQELLMEHIAKRLSLG